MKRVKLIVAIVAIVLLFTSCAPAAAPSGTSGGQTATTPPQTSGGSSSGGSATAPATEAAAEFSYPMDPVTISINMTAPDRSAIPGWVGEYYFWDQYQARTGVTLDFVGGESASIDMTDEFLLLLASLQYPDLLMANWAVGFPGGPTTAISDGYIVPLNDYVDSFPNMMAYLEDHVEHKSAIMDDEGTIYCFPKMQDALVNTGLVIRQDWLDQLNLEAPETVDEYYNVLSAFRDNIDSCKSPLTFESRWLFLEDAASSISSAWLVTYPFMIVDGQLTFGPLQESYPEFLAEMNKWYKEGLIDKDWASVDKSTVQAKFANGEAGLSIQQASNVQNCIMANLDNESYSVLPRPALIMNEGDEPQMSQMFRNTTGGHSVGISTQCKDVATACRFLDYLYSEEGYIFASFGTEGFSYDVIDGEYVLSDIVMNNPDTPDTSSARGYVAKVQNFAMVVYDRTSHFMPEIIEAKDIWWCNMPKWAQPVLTLTAEEANSITSSYNNIDTYSREMITKFVLGLEDLSNYDRFVDTLKSYGIDEVVKVRNAAYQRYLKRME